jgi:hypothetical protein
VLRGGAEAASVLLSEPETHQIVPIYKPKQRSPRGVLFLIRNRSRRKKWYGSATLLFSNIQQFARCFLYSLKVEGVDSNSGGFLFENQTSLGITYYLYNAKLKSDILTAHLAISLIFLRFSSCMSMFWTHQKLCKSQTQIRRLFSKKLSYRQIHLNLKGQCHEIFDPQFFH